jgi:glycosyltransferase involved in cell wall biosynthesis
VAENFRQVQYRALSDVNWEVYDALILVKRWYEPITLADRPQRIFWNTDVHRREFRSDLTEVQSCLAWMQGLLWMSEYQKSQAQQILSLRAGVPSVVLGFAIALEDYREVPEQRESLLLYCSIPDRGLIHLTMIFPWVRWLVPQARLVITSDFTLWGKEAAQPVYASFFDESRGVDYRGQVNRAELLGWQKRAKIMAYPCQFEEGFCLAAAECMAAGAVPVTTKDFALETTVGEGGVLIAGSPRRFWTRWLYVIRFTWAVVRLLKNESLWAEYSRKGRAKANRDFSPHRVAKEFESFLEALREGTC